MIICKECKMQITDENTVRCPRCNKLLLLKCGECKGCSVINSCKDNNNNLK